MRGHRCATIVQKSSGLPVEFIYRLVRGGTWFHDGEFATISPKFPHRSRNSALYSVVQGRDAVLDVTFSLSHPFFFPGSEALFSVLTSHATRDFI